MCRLICFCCQIMQLCHNIIYLKRCNYHHGFIRLCQVAYSAHHTRNALKKFQSSVNNINIMSLSDITTSHDYFKVFLCTLKRSMDWKISLIFKGAYSSRISVECFIKKTDRSKNCTQLSKQTLSQGQGKHTGCTYLLLCRSKSLVSLF